MKCSRAASFEALEGDIAVLSNMLLMENVGEEV
jgi:hypothetical protein